MSVEFNGNAAHTLDPKGRVIIPATYRELLGEQFTIGLNNQLVAIALYPKAEWTGICAKLSHISDTDLRGMWYKRLIIGNSFPDCTLDAQCRVLLPSTLRAKAGMTRNIRFVGMGEGLEIWDEDRYIEHSAKIEMDIESLLNYVDERYNRPKSQ